MKGSWLPFRMVIEILMAAALVYAPLAFGSAAPVYRPPLWILSFLLLVLTVGHLLQVRKNPTAGSAGSTYRPPVLSFWLFGGFLVYLLLFLIPLPQAVIGWLLPKPLGAQASWLPLHPCPEEGLRAFLDWACALIFLFVAATVPSRRRQIKRLVIVILSVAAFEAVYGMIEYAGGHQHIFGYAKVAYLDSATGTFVNRNHFANYLMMAFCLNLGVIGYLRAKSRRVDARENPIREKIPLILFYSVLLAAALLYSRSRGGLICLVFGVNVLALLSTRDSRKSLAIGLLILALLVVGFSFWIGANPVPDRFLNLSSEVRAPDSRWKVWAESVDLWLRSPVIGLGADAYGDVLRALGSGDILARYLHAHNDYLETLVETGLVGFFLLYGGIATMLWKTINSVKERSSRFARFYSLGMIAACSGMLLHGLMDFSLRIPANRILFFTLLGLAFLTATRRISR